MKYICLFFAIFSVTTFFAQNPAEKNSRNEKYIQVSGVVLDDSLQPLPFVSIMLKGTRSGTVSDFYGFFTINGCVALITVLIEDKFYWSIYNGAISYVLMGLMFAGELYCRKRYIKSA